jgi:hypothetical protein
MFSISAFADVTAGSSSAATTQSAAGANNAGNAQEIMFNNGGDSTTTLHTTPTVYVPSPANAPTQDNCDMLGTIGGSIINFGAAGSYVVHGDLCEWKQGKRALEASAAGWRALATQPGMTDTSKDLVGATATNLMKAGIHMQCLNSDRERAVLMKTDPTLCAPVADLATMDHRFNQPVNYGIDYAGRTSDDTPRIAGN